MPYGQTRIPIGRRREKVVLQEAVTADDGMGGTTITKWRTVSEPWAAVQALDERQKEALIAQQITAKNAFFVTIPYQAAITPDLRIIVRDITMQIHSVVDDEGRRRRLFLQVGEVQS